MNNLNWKNWIYPAFFSLFLGSTTLMYGCSSVSDPETMKTTSGDEQTQSDNAHAQQQQKTAQNQKSTSGRILAAGSHITGAMFGG